MIKRVFVGALILVLAFSLCSCNTNTIDGDGYKTNRIRVNTGITYGSAIVQVMELEGYLEQELPNDVKIQWPNFGGQSTGIRDGLATNQLDIGSLSYPSFITAIENGLPLVLLSGTTPQPFAIFSTRPDINSFADIKDHHKIGMSGRGTNVELAFSLRCQEVFGNATKFANNIVDIPDADMVSLIQGADSYDLYAVGFPSMQIMAGFEGVKLIEDLTDTVLKYGISLVLVTSEDFYNNNPTLIDAFYKAAELSADHMHKNPEEAAAKLSEIYRGVSSDVTLELIKRCSPDLRVTSYDAIADMLYDMGVLSTPAKRFSELPNYNSIPK